MKTAVYAGTGTICRWALMDGNTDAQLRKYIRKNSSSSGQEKET